MSSGDCQLRRMVVQDGVVACRKRRATRSCDQRSRMSTAAFDSSYHSCARAQSNGRGVRPGKEEIVRAECSSRVEA